MGRIKVFIYFIFFLIANNAIAQIDTVTFQFVPDYATFRIKCHAQKVIAGDTSYFEITDTLNNAYSLDWGGDIEPVVDGLPLVTYEFLASGIKTFSLSVVEDATGKTFTEIKTFDIRDIIRVPNVFTPNGDGDNDRFVINANGIDPLEITIFSRTGAMVFSNKSPIIVWDGRNSSGSELSEGVYYYILKSDDPAVADQTGFIHMYR
ncbi:MAG: gliding motility-associated C-terminal domain-containing protein [Bacteroidales bacterium]|nr:gliding motility-associated C-terminal domain-containing protein [Bacteroidales bacterium]